MADDDRVGRCIQKNDSDLEDLINDDLVMIRLHTANQNNQEIYECYSNEDFTNLLRRRARRFFRLWYTNIYVDNSLERHYLEGARVMELYNPRNEDNAAEGAALPEIVSVYSARPVDFAPYIPPAPSSAALERVAASAAAAAAEEVVDEEVADEGGNVSSQLYSKKSKKKRSQAKHVLPSIENLGKNKSNKLNKPQVIEELQAAIAQKDGVRIREILNREGFNNLELEGIILRELLQLTNNSISMNDWDFFLAFIEHEWTPDKVYPLQALLISSIKHNDIDMFRRLLEAGVIDVNNIILRTVEEYNRQHEFFPMYFRLKGDDPNFLYFSSYESELERQYLRDFFNYVEASRILSMQNLLRVALLNNQRELFELLINAGVKDSENAISLEDALVIGDDFYTTLLFKNNKYSIDVIKNIKTTVAKLKELVALPPNNPRITSKSQKVQDLLRALRRAILLRRRK